MRAVRSAIPFNCFSPNAARFPEQIATKTVCFHPFQFELDFLVPAFALKSIGRVGDAQLDGR
jgi:hypothetical protein